MSDLYFDLDSMISFLVDLLKIPSPTGWTDDAIDFIERSFRAFPVSTRRNAKRSLITTWEGRQATQPRALTAHVDTLGAMVAEIKEKGRLKLTQIGGYIWNSVEGESVTIHLADGRRSRGTILTSKASVHVYGNEAAKLERNAENMEVRIDARVTNPDEVRALGIEVGDFVSFDPRVEVVDTGFIRSRHMDDKAGIACIYGALKALADAGLEPSQRTTLLITTYEEVGHGGATGFPDDIVELLTVDMGAVGEKQNSDEFCVSICAKDSTGPYDLQMRQKMVGLAKTNDIDYKVDVYPHYGSDGSAYWRAGGDV
ncbi:MAG: M42 family metallopeptidase, partial [Anaerolineales bacterium]|nr:M42 family metallopeptidase [Anaerolineales bacterium]